MTRLVDVVAVADEAERVGLRAGLAERAVTVADLLGRPVSFRGSSRGVAGGVLRGVG